MATTWGTLRRLQMSHSVLPDARHVVIPKGIASTGLPAVEGTCRQIGISFDDWQRDLNRLILGKTADGMYAADTVVMSICRQAGKTYDIGGLVFADAIINPGTTTVWTAHQFKVARETFNELRTWARSPLLAPHIDYDLITTAAGNECIPFRNGSRIVFAARERGAIRGFTKVRRLILDEGQILTEAAMADLAPTMNQAVNPQIIIMGTPPKPRDAGEVFTALRMEALEGDPEGLLYVEYAAPDSSPVRPHERGFWDGIKAANPSYPSRTGRRSILRLRKLLTDDDDFRREAQGVWDAAGSRGAIPPAAWRECSGTHDSSLPLSALGIASTLDLTRSTLVAATLDGDVTQVRPVHRQAGAGWVVEQAKALQDEHSCSVVIDGRGPAAVLIPHLEQAGVVLTVMTTGDVLDACAGFLDTVRERRVRHAHYEELDSAVASAVQRSVGDRWAWGRKASGVDITPLEAATFAHWLLTRPAPEQSVSAYEDTHGVLTI